MIGTAIIGVFLAGTGNLVYWKLLIETYFYLPEFIQSILYGLLISILIFYLENDLGNKSTDNAL